MNIESTYHAIIGSEGAAEFTPFEGIVLADTFQMNSDDRTIIVYNLKVTIAGTPEEAERYMLGSRSALAWIIDRYQVKIDKACGIVNDPNDWCDVHDDPTSIVDLIKRVTTVSVETMQIVDSL